MKAVLAPCILSLALLAGLPAAFADSGDFKVGFSLQMLERLHQDSDAYYVRLIPTGAGFHVTEISSVPLTRVEGEEILGYLADSNTFLPAFDIVPHASENDYLYCAKGLLGDKRDRSKYAPCHSGSALTGTSVVGSAFGTAIIGAISLGTTVAQDLHLQRKKIEEVVRNDGVLQHIANLRQANSAASAAMHSVREDDARLAAAANVAVSVRNKTGFAGPTVSRQDVGLTMGRNVEAIQPLLSVTTESSEGASRAYVATVEGSRMALLGNRSLDVRCSQNVAVKRGSVTFKGKVACPASAAVVNGKISIPVTVELQKVSFTAHIPNMHATNAALSATVRDGTLVIENRTGEYIEIESIALYGGTNISDNQEQMSLAPLAVISRDVDSLSNPAINEFRVFSDVSFADVGTKSLSFGIAIKYRVGQGGNFGTLLKRESYPVPQLMEL